jgi:hypothetical protein
MARPHQGRILGIPYNLAPLKRGEFRREMWDPDDDRIFPPKGFGWGWGFNAAAFMRRLRARSNK